MKGPNGHWKARPFSSALLHALIFLAPIGAGLAVAIGLNTILPHPRTVGEAILWWATLTGGTFIVLYGAERAARRLLPLAVLLKLSLAFPDRAPSRYAVARRSGNLRQLEATVEEAHQNGDRTDVTRAAETILALVGALNAHDRSTRGHSERVRAFTDLIAEEMKVPGDGRARLRWAALLHDVGKITVPQKILNKDGPLKPEEWAIVHRHPDEGIRMASPLLPWLGEWAGTIRDHHERWDGTGYPRRLAGEDISSGARIVAVADAYETMTAPRPYRPRPLGAEAAREELARHSSLQFDPVVVRALLNVSISRLWRALGLMAWLAQIPILGRLRQLTDRTTTVAETSSALAKTAVAVGVLSLLGTVLSGGGGRGPQVVAAEEPGVGAAIVGHAAPADPRSLRAGVGLGEDQRSDSRTGTQVLAHTEKNKKNKKKGKGGKNGHGRGPCVSPEQRNANGLALGWCKERGPGQGLALGKDKGSGGLALGKGHGHANGHSKSHGHGNGHGKAKGHRH